MKPSTEADLLERIKALEDLVRYAPGLRSLYIGDHTCLVRLKNGRRLYVDSRDINHGQELMVTGRWERANTALVERLLAPGDTFVDVGANFGYFSMVAGPLIGAKGKLHCFEPIPRVAELLRQSLKANGYLHLHGIASVHACAVGARSDTVQLRFKEGDYSGGSLFVSDSRAKAETFCAVDVPLKRLDDALKKLSHADLVKIDVEGGEMAVVEGMAELIARSPRMRILLEFNPLSLAKQGSLDGFIDRIERDFRVHRVSADGTHACNPRELPPGNHYLCLAREVLALRWTLT